MDGDMEDEATEALPLATVTELDITAQMPSRDETTADEDDTGIYEGATVEMPAAENDDDTREMDIDGGKVDTKVI